MSGAEPVRAGTSVEPERFRHAFRQVPAAVAVVLTREAQGTVRGVTCTSATALSADPPMALVCVNERTGIGELAAADGWFSINFLAADRAQLARAFALGNRALDEGHGSDDGFVGLVRIGFGRTGVPVLTTGTISVVECRLETAHRGGDHWVLLGAVLHARFQADVEPLCYGRGGYGRFARE